MLLTRSTVAGLKFLADMRLLTIAQFARASGLSDRHAGDFLHSQKQKGFLGQSGGVPLAGQGRAPKLYYMTRKGWEHFADCEQIDLAPFANARPRAAWSQSMPHRIQTVSLYQAFKEDLRETEQGAIPFSRFDFRKGVFMGRGCKETTDFVSVRCDAASRIIPDASLCLERADRRRALAFLECDMGTETLSTQIAEKLEKYCRYYRSGCFAERYSEWGEFQSFMVLFVTTSQARFEALRSLDLFKTSSLARLFFVTTHEQVQERPLAPIWSTLEPGHESPRDLLGNS